MLRDVDCHIPALCKVIRNHTYQQVTWRSASFSTQQSGEEPTFPNEAGLEAIGDNYFLETPASGTATTGSADSTGFGSILQGSLESSNVNAVSEITNLITAQRAYEMNSKIITASDEMMRSVTNIR